MTYLDPSDGTIIASTMTDTDKCCSRISNKQAIAMNSDGSFVAFITRRDGNKAVTVNGVQFDGSNFIDQIVNIASVKNYRVWYANDSTGGISDQKYSIVISPDDDYVLTFSTALNQSVEQTFCRMDVWKFTGTNSPDYPDFRTFYFSREGPINDDKIRHCRFPTIHPDAALSQNTVSVITEYYGSGDYKAGLLRTTLNNQY